ncbi:hypothetical protein [Lentibacter sp. XHP0401]|uniref:hypothetical protein n=1 Tax=Lentibacter sp. XHP0401 TaxID=2984334 RepID=UPI0021E88462|nr:hypothetical protein [Lentibacter sp. XHP0401]MCV2893340.1 hypothetical protein [Lentibacter sp. XHP0401]
MDGASLSLIKLLFYALIALAIWFFFYRETEEQKEQKRLEQERRTKELERLTKERAEQEELDRQHREAQRLERERKKADAEKEFDSLVSKGMPNSVAKAHRDYKSENPLPRGQSWYGEDVSPLTFYGYRVGKTRGLRQSERREIIRYVMRARLTDPLAKTYQTSWGRPLTRQRRNAIIHHIDKLAAQRGTRIGYEVAVAEWTADGEWAAGIMDEETKKFSQYAFK